MHDFPKFNPLHSKMDCITHNDRIELAIADLESQERLNYADITKKWNVDRSTLSRRRITLRLFYQASCQASPQVSSLAS
jgi:hypothetical protein